MVDMSESSTARPATSFVVLPDETVTDDELPPELDPVLEALDRLLEEVQALADNDVRLLALNTVIDGHVMRTLQGERQKLDPWGRWMHSTYLDASQGHPEWRESGETRRVVTHWKQGVAIDYESAADVETLDANLIVSDTGIDDSRGRRLHIPMFDIDLPMRVVPSTNPGKGHLYVNKPMPWKDIMVLLDALVATKIVHRNYREHSAERGSTTLRPAFVRKPNKGWSSDGDTPIPDAWIDDPMVPNWAKPKVTVVDHATDGSVCWCDPEVQAY